MVTEDRIRILLPYCNFSPDAFKFCLGCNVLGRGNSTGTQFASLSDDWGTCGTGNPIDDCWRCDKDWESHRQALASCAMGFGRDAVGGRNGHIYTVTSDNDDDVADPQPGTLRHAATREEPLWITFAKSMTIYLQQELILTSFKTIDGRGVDVHITGGAGLTLQRISNVIIHGIHIHDIKVTGPARIMSNVTHVGERGIADGDAITIYTSKQIWIDHCSFAKAADGLIDAIHGSSMITISNNQFANHNKVFQRCLLLSTSYHVGCDLLIPRLISGYRITCKKTLSL